MVHSKLKLGLAPRRIMIMDNDWTNQIPCEMTCSPVCTCNGFAKFLCNLKNWLPRAGEDEAPEKEDMNAKEGNEPPHKKNKKHRKHKSKKKKRRRKGEKESSSESGAESDVEPAPPPRPVRTTRARSEELKFKLEYVV